MYYIYINVLRLSLIGFRKHCNKQFGFIRIVFNFRETKLTTHLFKKIS